MSRPTYVYFIKPVGMAGPIKIGCSWLPRERMGSLATWSPFPLEIIIWIPGGQRLEKNIHECFADLHSHREWFRPGRRLLDAIERLRAGEPVDQAINLENRRGKITKGRVGGAGWSDVTRQKMSVLTRVRHALKRVGIENQYFAPKEISKLVDASGRRILDPSEAALIKAFCANPSPLKDECLARYEEWKGQIDAHKISHVALRSEEAA